MTSDQIEIRDAGSNSDSHLIAVHEYARTALKA